MKPEETKVEIKESKNKSQESKVEVKESEKKPEESEKKPEESKVEVNESEKKPQEASVSEVDGKVKDSQDSGFCDTDGGNNKPSGCKLDGLLKKQDLPEGAVFMSDNWRQQLCICDNCKAQYKSEGVSFLLDEEDTVAFYEESGKTRHRSRTAPAERELEALSSLDRVTRTEMVHEYNTLSSSLREYLKKFAENKKVVRDEDIREFFSQLAANKKQRPGSSIQLFCK